MNRRVTLIAILAAVVVLVAWYFLLWSPRSDELDAARERKQQAEQQNQNLEAQLARLRADQQREPQLRASLEKLRVAIPDRPDLAQFILDTNDAAVRSGIDWVSIAPTPPAAATPAVTATTTTAPGTTGTTGTAPPPVAQPPAQIIMSMQVNGGYFQVMDFLNRLDGMPRIVVVDGLNLTGDGAGRLSATLTARMFTQPSAVAPPPGQTTTTAPPAGGTTATTGAAGATTTTTGARP